MELTRFRSLTVQFYVDDITTGVEFSTRVLGRPPNFAPTPDFHEWDHIASNVTFQLGEGTPRPTYPIRFGVDDLEAERDRVLREARPHKPRPSSASRVWWPCATSWIRVEARLEADGAAPTP